MKSSSFFDSECQWYAKASTCFGIAFGVWLGEWLPMFDPIVITVMTLIYGVSCICLSVRAKYRNMEKGENRGVIHATCHALLCRVALAIRYNRDEDAASVVDTHIQTLTSELHDIEREQAACERSK